MSNYRELKYVRFYKDRVDVGKEGYNPEIILSFNTADELIKVKESWRDEVWEQTVSGTNSSGPISQVVAYETIYDPWIKI